MRNNFLAYPKAKFKNILLYKKWLFRVPKTKFKKIFEHKRNNLLGFWVVGNGRYPATDLKLRQKFKNQNFLNFVFWNFCLSSSLSEEALFPTTSVALLLLEALCNI